MILIVWFGVKSALSAAQGHGGGFHFAKFADLILMIAFGLGMLTYYSTPIPGIGYSFSDLITKEGLNLSDQIESDKRSRSSTPSPPPKQQLGAPPGSFNILRGPDLSDDRTSRSDGHAGVCLRGHRLRLCRHRCLRAIGPIFIPWFIVPKMDWLFWGWFKAFIGFSFYQVVASAFIFIFSKVLVGMFQVIGTLCSRTSSRSCPRC